MTGPRVVDLSHPIEDGMAGYPGLPGPRVVPHLTHEDSRGRYAEGTEFTITRYEFVGNVGTYVDAPFHRYRDGIDISELPLERLVGREPLVLDASPTGREVVLDVDPAAVRGRAVLVRTGWDAAWATDAYWEPGPYLATATAEALAAAEPALVGVDFWNVDDTTGNARPVHSVLLAAGVPIVEHLCRLDQVATGARVSVVPLAVRGAGSFPVRAFAELP